MRIKPIFIALYLYLQLFKYDVKKFLKNLKNLF